MNLKFLVFLHSLGFSHRLLRTAFSDGQDYEGFYRALSMDSLHRLGLKEEKIATILTRKSELERKFRIPSIVSVSI